MQEIAVSELTKGARVILKHGTYTVSNLINTGNATVLVLDGLGVRDWPNYRRVKVAEAAPAGQVADRAVFGAYLGRTVSLPLETVAVRGVLTGASRRDADYAYLWIDARLYVLGSDTEITVY